MLELRALARAATQIEAQTSAGRELLKSLLPQTGRAVVVGVTGPPGAGKSTLVNALTKHLRAEGKTVGIIAVDPSSPYTRGALLGDRVRMMEHHADRGVFIRSVASRGQLGGLAACVKELALLLDGAGWDVVIIETVGVGQDEVDIARLADVTVLVLAPGFGDEVQAIKAGIMEIADVIAINKSDQPGVDRFEQEIRANHERALIRVVSTENKGIGELWGAVIAVYKETGQKQGLRNFETVGVEIDHLGVAVRSLDAGLEFYEGLLGMRVADRESVAPEGVNVAMLPVAGGGRIELLEASDESSAIAKFIEKRGPGLHHLALRVDDLKAAVERLKQRGARLVNEPRAGAGGHTYVFIHPASTGGVLIELIQK